MRIVKYQAWTDEGMINVRRITFAGDVVYAMSDNDEHDGYEFQISPDKLRCFTGLKDKNGKEIYEGDILANAYHYPVSFSVKYGDILGAVVWQDCGFWVGSKNDRPLMGDGKEYEIIGNIWENGDLLK